MTEFATRCPDCHTSFHVTEAQLDIAHGLVRCGACLQIFNAHDNLVEDWPEPESPPEQNAVETDESWAEMLLREEMAETEEEELPVLTDDVLDREALDELEGPPDETTDDDQSEETEDDDAAEEMDDIAGLRLRALRDIEAAPVRPKRRNGLWFSLSVIALLGLGAQYIGYHFDELVQSSHRPLFEQACAQIRRLEVPCSLPAPSRPELIRAQELLVRDHPEQEQALRIDTVIINRAPFAQPFPLLELEFRNLQGEPVARRRFRPDEYLAGELRDARLMPSDQPVQIGLDLVDPGSRAVNYELHLIPARSS